MNLHYIFCRLFCLILFSVTTISSISAQTPAEIFANIEVERTSIYLHEPFYLTLSVYSSRSLDKNMELTSMPGQNVLKTLEAFKQFPVEKTPTHEIYRFKCKVMPMLTGPINIAPELTALIIVREKHGFFTMETLRSPRKIAVEPVTLSISGLPEAGRPKDFSGAVGQFSFNMTVSPLDIAVGDIITAVMNINGDGYLDGAAPTGISSGNHFKIYDLRPISSSRQAELAFEQTLIPQSTNAVRVPSVSFSYFDPSSGSYKTITRGPFPLSFHRAVEISGDERYRPEKSKPADIGKTKPILSEYHTLDKLGPDINLPGKEAILVKSESARLAPAYSAIETFKLSGEAIVKILDIHEDWVKVQSENKRGWLPMRSLSLK